MVCGMVTVAICGVTGGVWYGDCGNMRCHWWCVWHGDWQCVVSLVVCGL